MPFFRFSLRQDKSQPDGSGDAELAKGKAALGRRGGGKEKWECLCNLILSQEFLQWAVRWGM